MNYFCDKAPCSLLQEFIQQLSTSPRPGAALEVLILVPRSDLSREPIRQTSLYYCPLCGTRLYDNEELIKWIEGRQPEP